MERGAVNRHAEVVSNPLIPANLGGLEFGRGRPAETGRTHLLDQVVAESRPIVAQQRRQARHRHTPAVHVGDQALEGPTAGLRIAALGVRHRLEDPVECDPRPEIPAWRGGQRNALGEIVATWRRREVAESSGRACPRRKGAVDRLGRYHFQRHAQPPCHGSPGEHLEIVGAAEDQRPCRDALGRQAGRHQPGVEATGKQDRRVVFWGAVPT